MKIIAHRANINGCNSSNENRLSQIRKCIELGYDVEIDIRVIKNSLFLGHDCPEEKITEKEIFELKEICWIHCKNLEAINYFKQFGELYNYFWHENDKYTLTSKGYIWTYPGELLSVNSIWVMPEQTTSINKLSNLKNKQLAGICTDYPNLIT